MSEAFISAMKFLKEYGLSDAIFGFIGVIIGGLIVVANDFFSLLFKQRKNAEYLSIQVVCILDKFVDKCYEVVLDDGTYQGEPAGRHYTSEDKSKYEIFYEPQISLPTSINYANDIDWKSIDAGLMYKILMLPNNIMNTNHDISISGENSSPPNFEELFDARQGGYARLGLEAVDITDKLRKKYNLPERNFEFYDPKATFEETIQKYKR